MGAMGERSFPLGIQSGLGKGILAASAVAGLFCLTTLPAWAASMPTNGRTTQPIGHYEFCQRAPEECRATGQAAPHALTDEAWRAMVRVNDRINSHVRPLTDQQIWGREELWSYPTDVGDCEDYVLAKRQQLIAEGFHPSNLLITVVRQKNGEGHAVLTVRTNRGDFILDNLVGQIDHWRSTPYVYLKRQSETHAGRWESIEDNSSRVLALR